MLSGKLPPVMSLSGCCIVGNEGTKTQLIMIRTTDSSFFISCIPLPFQIWCLHYPQHNCKHHWREFIWLNAVFLWIQKTLCMLMKVLSHPGHGQVTCLWLQGTETCPVANDRALRKTLDTTFFSSHMQLFLPSKHTLKLVDLPFKLSSWKWPSQIN